MTQRPTEAGDPDSSGDTAEEEEKEPLHCSKCGEHLKYRSHMLLFGGGKRASWQGKIWGCCQPCSGLTAKEFKSQQRWAWEQRAKELRGRRERARDLTFKNARRIIEDTFPNYTKQEVRTLAYARCKAAALAFVAGFEKDGTWMMAAAEENCKMYLRDIELAELNPARAASIEGKSLTSHEISYLTEIASGCTLSFVCRDRSCLWYGCNDQWAEHRSKYWFRCPQCGKHFRPWVQSPDEVTFAFVLSIPDIATGERMNIPAVWPASEEMGWLNRQIEARVLQLKSEGDFEKWRKGCKTELSTLLHNIGTPDHFRKFAWKPEVEERLDSRTYRFDHLKEKGFVMGGRLSPEGNLDHPFENWSELITLIARVLVVGREMATTQLP
jgi:hypothetical protein